MTNSGGGDPLAGPLRPVGPREVDRAAQAQDVEATGGAESTAAPAAPEEIGAVSGARPSDAVAQALAAGQIDAEAARAQLIDDALRAQLPAGSDPALVADLRAELEAIFAADPVLARLLTPAP
jgi:hypothetical protein